MSERVEYDDIPQTMRDLLDEIYTREGVEIFWNSHVKPIGGVPAAAWQTVEGRGRVISWVEYLTGGGW